MTRESDIEKYLHQRIKDLGGEHRRLAYTGRNNANDDLVLLPGRHCVVECKRPKKDATEAQAREHRRLSRAGFETHVVSTKVQIDALFPAPLVPHVGRSLLSDPES